MTSLISIQLNGQASVDHNLQRIRILVKQACEQAHEDRLVVLPECCILFGAPSNDVLASAEAIDSGVVQDALRAIAKENSCYLVAGTMAIKTPVKPGKYFAASLVFNPSGERIARYNKIHLFDVDVADNTASYKESKHTIAGEHISLFDGPFGSVGQTVCYDLRFSALFLALAQQHPKNQAPQIIVVPSAFTKVTGKAHWHALLKARSIEHQCFIVASNQSGTHADGRETFGNSCIYSPWGECLSLIEHGEGFAIAEYNAATLNNIRMKMPIYAHKKERYQIES